MNYLKATTNSLGSQFSLLFVLIRCFVQFSAQSWQFKRGLILKRLCLLPHQAQLVQLIKNRFKPLFATWELLLNPLASLLWLLLLVLAVTFTQIRCSHQLPALKLSECHFFLHLQQSSAFRLSSIFYGLSSFYTYLILFLLQRYRLLIFFLLRRYLSHHLLLIDQLTL